MDVVVSVTITRRRPVSESRATRKQIQFIQSFRATILFPGKVNDFPSVQIAKEMDAEAF
jgi:hypothetical protein